jgi:hypothetical protein
MERGDSAFFQSKFPPMVRAGLILAFLAAAGSAQQPDGDVPAVTPAGFSQIVGRYQISVSAAPTEVRVEEPIVLTVRIAGTGPEQYRPQRKNLRVFPENFDNDFYVEDAADRDQYSAADKAWDFVYRIRPKRLDVSRIPELRLCYYDPQTKKFPVSYSDEIPIKVTPRPDVTAGQLDLKVVQAPARFYQLRPAEEVVRDDSLWPPPSTEGLAALLALPPALCLVWYRLWRRLYPDAAERRHRQRSRAARLALAYLEKQAPDVPRTRAAAVDYLRQRFELSATEPTPHEVAFFLKRLGVAKKLAAEWSSYLEECDRLRYAPTADGERVSPDQPKLAVEAMRLIHALEADPCAGR